MAMTTYLCEECGKGRQIEAGIEMVLMDAFFVFRSPRPTHEPWYLCSTGCLMRWGEKEHGFLRVQVEVLA